VVSTTTQVGGATLVKRGPEDSAANRCGQRDSSERRQSVIEEIEMDNKVSETAFVLAAVVGLFVGLAIGVLFTASDIENSVQQSCKLTHSFVLNVNDTKAFRCEEILQ
jgi:hypothetical protein